LRGANSSQVASLTYCGSLALLNMPVACKGLTYPQYTFSQHNLL